MERRISKKQREKRRRKSGRDENKRKGKRDLSRSWRPRGLWLRRGSKPPKNRQHHNTINTKGTLDFLSSIGTTTIGTKNKTKQKAQQEKQKQKTKNAHHLTLTYVHIRFLYLFPFDWPSIAPTVARLNENIRTHNNIQHKTHSTKYTAQNTTHCRDVD